MANLYNVVAFIFLSLGLSLSGYFLGSGLQYFKTGQQRAVTVKGISQKTVTSDTLKIEIKFWDYGEDAAKLREQGFVWQDAVLDVLTKSGFKKDDILIIPADIHERKQQIKDTERNIVEEKKELYFEQTIKVISSDLSLAEKINEEIKMFSKLGVKYNMDLQYDFTDLDSIRPSMIAESLISAQKAAAEFAKASGVKIGKISKANQGRFVVTSPSATGDYDHQERYSKIKKIRVVSNITFDLD